MENPNPQQPPVPEWDSDIAERIAGFNAALAPLLGKYELGLGASPRFAPDGRVVADPILVSMRKAPGTEEAPAPQPEKKSKLSKAD